MSKNGKDEILETEELHATREPADFLKEPGTEIPQNPTLKRTNVEDALNKADEILEMEERQSREERDRPLEVPRTEIPQDLTLKRIKVEDAFSQVIFYKHIKKR